ncbi:MULTISPECIES: glycosyltransferase family 4 protein [Idiomarina]|uniref:glycosyltransferase family 4 protein n=1 Tax=Idiomarina TaxID=135575 RepID=UPI00129CD12B|nr:MULTISPECIES: glycosyltransferase family 4 protein [Idiomarina]MRJ42538.1 glycosyltransferase [Idiomarina sp. FeN1]NCU58151.1 glycosyltransferase [Idiomarina sp. FenA--70]NCU60849.1 glycosyltransferase [Idiomarina sp. FenBw--71]UUN12747.1 glycosyltransferase family 4 protein [Idiomarina loihiensis]
MSKSTCLQDARDTILLCGGYQLPDRNASAIRALGTARLLQTLGYKVYVLGKLPTSDTSRDINRMLWQANGLPDIECISINKPTSDFSGRSYVVSADPIEAFVAKLGAGSVRAILTYNYSARGTNKVNQFCRQHGIASILDCTEWYGWEGRNIIRNITRLFGVHIKMRYLTKQAGNVIVASYFLERFLPKQHLLKLPFVVDPNETRWQQGPLPENEQPVFTYSGSPGPGMHKDRLPIMVSAFAKLKQQAHVFKVNIVGLTEQQYLAVMPEHRNTIERLGDSIQFFGRVAHSESISLLKSSDFSVFFRKPNRVANVGFSTKYVEAATLGIPVISNETSDLAAYLKPGKNGFLAREFSNTAIEQALTQAVSLSAEERKLMHLRCRKLQPFNYQHWLSQAESFFNQLVVRK